MSVFTVILSSEMCSPATPFSMLSDLFDGNTLDKCAQVFTYVADGVETWKKVSRYVIVYIGFYALESALICTFSDHVPEFTSICILWYTRAFLEYASPKLLRLNRFELVYLIHIYMGQLQFTDYCYRLVGKSATIDWFAAYILLRYKRSV